MTTQVQDGDARCANGIDGKCFTFYPGANMYNSELDFLIYEIRLPTKDSGNVIDLGAIAWDLSIDPDTEASPVKLEISCTSPENFFTDQYYGQPSDSATFIDTTAFGARTNGYTSTPALSIKSHTATIRYGDTYYSNQDGNEPVYWGVIPFRTKNLGGNSAKLSCTANFKAWDTLGYNYDMLSIAESSNGPFYNKPAEGGNAAVRYRDNYYSGSRTDATPFRADDKAYMNFVSDEGVWKNGGTADFTVQLRVQFGLARDSWCLAALPKEFTGYTDAGVTTTQEGKTDAVGNLTLTKSFNWNGQQVLILHNSVTNDIWPGWTENLNVNGLKAPYGE